MQRRRIAEMEALLNAQQATLDALVGDAMGEVSKREKEWLSVRTHKEARIAELADALARAQAAHQQVLPPPSPLSLLPSR